MPDKGHPGRSDSDRRLRQAARFARILRVLEMIQGKAGCGLKGIAAELEVSERTVFRDLNVLELAGVPWFYDPDGQRYRVRPGYHFPAINLGEDELIGQATAAVITSAQGLDVTEGARPATKKLRANSRDRTPKLLDDVENLTAVLDLKLADHREAHATIRTIQAALAGGWTLIGQYRSPYNRDEKRVELHPYRLCMLKQAWYLVARPRDSDRPRTYRVARFRSLRTGDGPSVVPGKFDLRSYFGNAWGVYRGAKSYEVEIRFTPEAAELVAETNWHSTQQARRHRDGGVTLSFVIDGLEEVAFWVLGWSGRAAVVRPPELREVVLGHLRRAIELNRG